MKKSKIETAETRKRIVQAAAEAFRCNGIHATGVAEIMSAAGLTHGGFYRHFESKEHLVAEACAAGMASTLGQIGAAAKEGDESFIAHFDAYLSDESRSNRLGECPLVAMGSELARADIETRGAATRGYRELIELMTKKSTAKKEDAIFAFSAILGALTVSRIVDDPELSNLILAETRQRIARFWPNPCGTEISASCDDGDAV